MVLKKVMVGLISAAILVSSMGVVSAEAKTVSGASSTVNRKDGYKWGTDAEKNSYIKRVQISKITGAKNSMVDYDSGVFGSSTELQSKGTAKVWYRGDIDGDGIISTQDLDKYEKYKSSKKTVAGYRDWILDVTDDNKIDSDDYEAVYRYLKNDGFSAKSGRVGDSVGRFIKYHYGSSYDKNADNSDGYIIYYGSIAKGEAKTAYYVDGDEVTCSEWKYVTRGKDFA